MSDQTSAGPLLNFVLVYNVMLATLLVTDSNTHDKKRHYPLTFATSASVYYQQPKWKFHLAHLHHSNGAIFSIIVTSSVSRF